MNTIFQYVFYFFMYSAIGWFVESIYCSIGNKRWINRGFLKGPICPIYGTGAVVMMICIEPFSGYSEKWYINSLIVFALGMVLCDIVELLRAL